MCARARADLCIGVPVVLRAKNCAALVVAAEEITVAGLTQLRGMGAPELAITQRRAETLRARAYDGDLARLLIPQKASVAWIRATADPAHDLDHPMKGPYNSLREGDPVLHRAAIALCKAAHLLPAAVLLPVENAHDLANESDLHILDVGDLTDAETPIVEVASAPLPLAVSSQGRVRVFRPDDGGEEHYLVEIGNPGRNEPVLARLHSACFTGDVIGSVKCDCGPQLRAALAQIGAEGAGILLYLNQEGRGIGLANKMRAYSLQEQGFDTVEANHRLGFEDDERDFRIGAQMLRAVGVSAVRLMTNNPSKVDKMAANGVAVAERVPLQVGRTAENTDYLDVKAAKSGHIL